MNDIVILFLCVTIFLPTAINGLQCYECDICNEPFTTKNASIVMTNNSTGSCYKLVTGITTTKGVMDNCIAINALGVGTWCCNTDLCNSAQSIVPLNLKMITALLLFTVGLMKVFQLY